MLNFKLKLLPLSFFGLNCTAIYQNMNAAYTQVSNKLKPFNYAKNSYT